MKNTNQKPLGVPKIVPRKTPLGVLRAARKLLEDPRRWTQRVFGRTADGESVQFDSLPGGRSGAVCFCVSGAIRACAATGASACEATLEVFGAIPQSRHIFDWNDAKRRRHADVLAALDRAIASLSSSKGSRKSPQGSKRKS